MTRGLSVEETEERARGLLDRRIASIRELVTARQRLADLQEQVAAAEREDVRLFAAAQRDGWTAEELKALGLGEPAKRERVRARAGARAATS